MAEITALFWDVGGVIGTNGWDREGRRRAVEKFQLDQTEFEDRHELVVPAFEKGQLSLDDYLDRTVFYRPRSFTKQEFKDFLFALSQPNPETLELLGRLASTGKYLLATLNNESLELNQDRIRRFGLRRYFTLFLSSCYVGLRKPDEAIYRLALQLTERAAEESLFIDDRPLNVECARRVGMRAVQFQKVPQLKDELLSASISF